MQRTTCALWAAFSLLVATPALAQNRGFEINRYQPTSAGEWSFAVDHPWYSSMRYFAAGLTFNYAHNPLVLNVANQTGPNFSRSVVIEHQLIAHVDLAASFLDRIHISASLPVTLFEAGYPQLGINPSNGLALGDPRLGAKVRLFGQPYRGPISLSLSADVWIPINSFSDRQPFPAQSGESGVRVLPKLIAGGLFSHILWSLTAGFYYRPSQAITGLAPRFGNSAGSELLVGAAIAYASLEHRFAIGPEAVYSATVLGEGALQPQTMSLDLLLAAHYNIARILQVGVAGGYGVLQQSGSPDARALLRLAYAPMKPEKPKDRDHDGVPDKTDLCPDEHQGSRPDPEQPGCPLRDRDNDDIADKIDQCPDEPAGAKPDPNKLGCPLRDKDGDGVLDADDQCVDEPAGPKPDPKKPGCPLRDRDADGVVDVEDQCVEMPAGPNPDPLRPGCPDLDSDSDGVFDGKDQCKTVPAGNNPDPARPGCPIPDRDKDMIPDGVDACPDKPGAPSADPKKNGCPGLVEVKGSMIVILQQVFFATNKDVILPKSFPVLNAVADVLSQLPQIKRVAVEGHTDNKGKADYNRDLSGRRAKSVMTYLVGRGIAEARLESHGYGPDKPVADNKTEKGRALNRRVDFVILQFQSQNGESLATSPPAAAAAATSPAGPSPTPAPAPAATAPATAAPPATSPAAPADATPPAASTTGAASEPPKVIATPSALPDPEPAKPKPALTGAKPKPGAKPAAKPAAKPPAKPAAKPPAKPAAKPAAKPPAKPKPAAK